MGWINLIVGAHALHNFAKAYANITNDTTTFVEPNPPTNIITNESFLTQYSIKQGLKVFAQKGEASVQKNWNSFTTTELSIQRITVTSLRNNVGRVHHT